MVVFDADPGDVLEFPIGGRVHEIFDYSQSPGLAIFVRMEKTERTVEN